PVQAARSSSPATSAVRLSPSRPLNPGTSTGGTVMTMKTGTSIELATPDTSSGERTLLVSMPSVSTTTAPCAGALFASRRAVVATASYKDVVPHGSALDNADSILDGCAVKGCSS